MPHGSRIGLLVAVCVLVACTDVPDAGPPAVQADRGVAAVADPVDTRAAASPAPPDEAEVRVALHGEDAVAGAADDDGHLGILWLGYPFTDAGVHRFTGFVTTTRRFDAMDAEDALLTHDDTVALGQATFEWTGAAWHVQSTDGYVGEFGRNVKPEALDTTRAVARHDTADGRMLIAVPTRDFINGSAQQRFAVFVFDPASVAQPQGRPWRYLGSVDSGEDNAAACAEGEVMPCIRAVGTLTFAAATGDARLPDLEVIYTGTTIAAPGRTRALGPADTQRYRFDDETEQYEPQASPAS